VGGENRTFYAACRMMFAAPQRCIRCGRVWFGALARLNACARFPSMHGVRIRAATAVHGTASFRTSISRAPAPPSPGSV